jgi:hypothetical protein
MANQVGDNAARATMAWRNATEDAGNFIDTLMQEYGWTTPGADGLYSTTNAADAFDPNNIMSFGEDGTANVDASRVAQLTSGGQYGAKGTFADIARGGASQEAEAIQAARSRGLGTGGLAKQQRQLSETMTGQQTSAASADLLRTVMQQYGGVRRAFSGVKQGQTLDAIMSGQTGSQYV